jgi:hypothetical protein
MKRRAVLTLLALIVALHVGGALAYAQTTNAEIGFPFIANGQNMAAGKYSIEVAVRGPVTLTGPDRKSIFLPVITMLGRHDKDADPEFVFDKVDGKVELSEIWPSGKDGFLVLATKGPHEHAVIGGSNPRK